MFAVSKKRARSPSPPSRQQDEPLPQQDTKRNANQVADQKRNGSLGQESSAGSVLNGSSAEDATSRPLEGVVACLSGFSPPEKKRLHQRIVELGGEFTRDLVATHNTHLITNEAQGAKYKTALKWVTSPSARKIRIVKSSWIEACVEQQQRVDESEPAHSLEATSSSSSSDVPKLQQSLVDALKHIDPQPSAASVSELFFGCRFYLLGFDEDDDEAPTKKTVDKDKKEDDTPTTIIHRLVGRQLRRCLGTIFWDLHEGVTHVVVNEHYALASNSTKDANKQRVHSSRSRNDSAQEVLQSLERPIANGSVVVVSPWWVVASVEANTLQEPSQFAPKFHQDKKTANGKTDSDDKAGEESQMTKGSATSDNTVRAMSALFRGNVFVLFRVSPPPGAVDFDAKQLEASIRSHGGQILSLKLLEVVKRLDRRRATGKNDSKENHPKCYVVCWGGHCAPSHFSIHPLLSQVQRQDLCDIVPVTPFWLRTCISEGKIVSLNRLPIILSPVSWPIMSLTPTDAGDSCSGKVKDGRPIRISVSGFVGYRRTAIIQFIQSIGAVYDDSMRTSTTHLICREPVGQKYEKAVEWKLHVVTIEWLYHIAQYGYKGQAGKEGRGCESRFSLIPDEQS